ncbi:MAG TPA: DUF3465 domain-containing protein [Steroidobacteraceae bacterium]|jgi:hypothetical protein
MKVQRLLLVGVVLAAVYFGGVQRGFIPARQDASTDTHSADALTAAFENHRSNVQVQGSGQVSRVLPDDIEGSPHQRFIVRLASGQTVLIAHNIELAPRVDSLKAGDQVEFNGEYEWNERGGVVHWTHRDPRGGHVAGWIRHNGRTYQ